MQTKVKPASEAFHRAVSAQKDIEYEELQSLLGIIAREHSLARVVSSLASWTNDEARSYDRAGLSDIASLYGEMSSALLTVSSKASRRGA